MSTPGEADLASIGTLIADRTRATFLMVMLSGGLTSASALAARAGVSPSLASNHLRKLTEGRLIVVERQGRQRMYRLASSSVADALEGLMQVAPAGPVASLRGSKERDALRSARLCYDHLAGRAGVAVTAALVDCGWLEERAHPDDRYLVTPSGVEGLAALGIYVLELQSRPRPLTRACNDWSEGRPHLAGSIGAALTSELLRRGWLESREASRVVAVTADGRGHISHWLDMDPSGFDLPDLTYSAA
jgi:DNA-binding transcriptional ArsR family regulator